MKLYSGIDLHSNNSMVVVLNEQDKVILKKKLPNDVDIILATLEPFKEDLQGVAVESTFNWYWLVDALAEAGYSPYLVNTAAVKQYEGLKHTDDQDDAIWLAHLLRLGILPTGYIYPKERRAIRDLLRKRGQLVRHRTAHILSIHNLFNRNTGHRFSCNAIKHIKDEDIEKSFPDDNLVLAMKSNVLMMRALDNQIKEIEKVVFAQVKLEPSFRQLLTIAGVGKILALTIMLETGTISRFSSVGDFASYCRCVGSVKLSNGKKKGVGNKKNGNKYLSWAFVEAANFSVRYSEKAKRFYQRKMQKTKRVVAIKALAHKLARASFYIMRDQVAFNPEKLFG